MAKDILQLVTEKEQQANRNLRRGVIICPGALGDCLLTLPLADYVKKTLDLGVVDFIGRTEYIDFYPGRSCVDGIKSIESIEFHRLFADCNDFMVEDYDRLIGSFSPYECIVSFMGADDPNFESNLIFTVSCSHPADVTMLPLGDKGRFSGHISEFYIRKFIEENGIDPARTAFDPAATLLKPHNSDVENGWEILKSAGVQPDDKLVIIHPGSGGQAKCWCLDNFSNLADRLIAQGVQVAFLLGPAEQKRFDAAALRRIESVGACIPDRDLAGVLQMLTWADCFVGNDSGVTHLAGSLGLRTAAIFGPTDPRLYKPIGPRVNVLQLDRRSFSRPSPAALETVFSTVCGALQD